MKALDAYLQAVAEEGYRDGHGPLFVAAWEHLEASYLARLDAAIGSDGEWRDRFRAGATETVELVEAYPREARFLAVEALTVGPLGRDRQRALGSRLAGLIDSARGELDAPDLIPPATGGWIVGIFFDRIYKRCTSGVGPDLPSQLPELMFLANAVFFGTEAGFAEFLRGS
ncbi:MAG: hypothetical protein QOF06_1676 [Solirubrobacterales bacterium]|nr:hypothetical protein [Solirubrobacterales bacterium]